MAFENVNVGSLRSAINSSISNLQNNLSGLNSNLAGGSAWECDAKNTLRNAISKLTGIRYTDLKNKLSKYQNIPNLIEQYQNLKKENERLTNENMSLQNSLYKTVTDYRTEYDENGRKYDVACGSHRELDYGVQNRMTSNKAKIDANKAKMNQLENQVSSSL